jgi:DNA polymerase I-like protein with 3'-5' exonuclease and polymerase domains
MVHDSLIFEIKNGREDYYLPLIKATMEAVTPDFGVKFHVEVKRWGT